MPGRYRRAVRDVPLTVARGFLMGSADIVPGVSGGTVALVLGIYRRLIDAIRHGARAGSRLFRADMAGFRSGLANVEWSFLLPLLAGIGLAVVSLSSAIESLLEQRPVEMGGLFCGLVGASVVLAWRLVRRWDAARLGVLAVTTVVVFAVLGLREHTSTADTTGSAPLWAFLGAGALAICAMILPGISGSFILVLLGMYGAVLGAVNDRALGSLAVFLVGCVGGLALFSQVLHWALEHHDSTVMAALIGLMAGSLRVLWPWPHGVESTALHGPSDTVVTPVVLAVVAFALVIGFDAFARRRAPLSPPTPEHF